jgi:hypothetical protein
MEASMLFRQVGTLPNYLAHVPTNRNPNISNFYTIYNDEEEVQLM